MASTGSHSASGAAGGDNKAVIGVRGARRKRKGLPEFSTCDGVTGEKKSFDRDIEMARTEDHSETKRRGLRREDGEKSAFRPERDEKADGGITVDEVEALKEFYLLARMGSCRSPAKSPGKLGTDPRHPFPLQWAIRKLRSSRLRRAETSRISNEDSHAIITSDDGTPPPLPQPLRHPVSESSFAPAGDSRSVVTLVNLEGGDLPCSSTEGAAKAEEDGQRRHRDQELEEKDEVPSGDPDVLEKLASVASNEFPQQESRVGSPASPLASQLLAAGSSSVSVFPKMEGCSSEGRSAFQRVAPARPVKKATLHRKPKAEDGTVESMNPEQATVRHVSRKKPRDTGLVHQRPQQCELPLLQQHLQRPHIPQQEQQQLAAVKVEEADGLCTLALGLPSVSVDEKQEEKNVVKMTGLVPDALVAEKRPPKVDPPLLKLSGRIGSRGSGKLKPALSEQEKEDRKLKRVQANRESARQTIRRKQVLCEELSTKSQFLTNENMTLRKEREVMLRKNKNLSDQNSDLKLQLEQAKANRNPGAPTFPTPVSSETPPVDLTKCQFPQFRGMGFPGHPYLWTIPMAGGGKPPSEMNVGAIDYTSVSNASVAFGSGLPAGWSRTGSNSQGQPPLAPPYFPSQPLPSSIAKTLPASSSFPDLMPSFSPLTRSISLPVGPGNASFSLVISERAAAQRKPLARYNSEDSADFSHFPIDSRNTVERDTTAHQGSSFGGSSHYRPMTVGSQPRMSAAVVGRLSMQQSGDGNALSLAPTACQFRGRSSSLGALHGPKMMSHTKSPMFVSGAMPLAQEHAAAMEVEAALNAAAAATEARRRRKERTRSKSLQHHRHPTRLAELPSV